MAEIDKVKEEASKYKACQGTSGIGMEKIVLFGRKST